MKSKHGLVKPASKIVVKQPSPFNRIGWTAQFTAAVWHELGVSGARPFVTQRGRWLKRVVAWGGGLFGLHGAYSVTNIFLAPRYLGINALLREANFAQIIELAAGLSARGSQWTRYHSGIYIEVDQPAVIAAKQKLSDKNVTKSARHILIDGDLRQTTWLEKVLPLLDPHQPTLIICEGLTGYLDEPALSNLLCSIRALALRFDTAKIWLDLYLRLDLRQHGRVARAMLPAQLLWKLGRAPMRMFLNDVSHMGEVLLANGFTISRLWSSSDLARLAGYFPSPPVALFYLIEMQPCRPNF